TSSIAAYRDASVAVDLHREDVAPSAVVFLRAGGPAALEARWGTPERRPHCRGTAPIPGGVLWPRCPRHWRRPPRVSKRCWGWWPDGRSHCLVTEALSSWRPTTRP